MGKVVSLNFIGEIGNEGVVAIFQCPDCKRIRILTPEAKDPKCIMCNIKG